MSRSGSASRLVRRYSATSPVSCLSYFPLASAVNLEAKTSFATHSFCTSKETSSVISCFCNRAIVGQLAGDTLRAG